MHSLTSKIVHGILAAAMLASVPGLFAAEVPAASPTAPIEPVRLPAALDPCQASEIAANPTRPTWDIAASTTQCNVLESDFGWLDQPMGAGLRQRMLVSSLRYGLTPRLDLRWGIANHMWQSGAESTQGTGDQWLSARYRFHEQGRWMPALALDYGAKIPTASGSKGLGSGFIDHQFLFVASRDLGHTHLDFDTVGTLAGAAGGHEGAAQFGLVATRPLSAKLSWMLEGYGGPQPGTPARYGAVLTGGAYALRPWLILDAAYAQAYTAGSPRSQFLFGFTCARRASWSPLSRRYAAARLLGR